MHDWKDSYDAWKTRSPDDEFDDECYHEEYDIGWDGRAECDRCGERWWPSEDAIRLKREASDKYDHYCRQQARREFWLRVTHPIRWPVYRLLNRIWPRKSCSVLSDDEIPF